MRARTHERHVAVMPRALKKRPGLRKTDWCYDLGHHCHPRCGPTVPHTMALLLSQFLKEFLSAPLGHSDGFTVDRRRCYTTFPYRSRYAPRSPGQALSHHDGGGLAERSIASFS